MTDTADAAAEGPRGAWRWMPLRLLVMMFAMLFAVGGAQAAIAIWTPSLPANLREPLALGATLLACVAWIFLYRLLVRWTERRSAREISLAGMVPGFAGGALIGLLLFCAVYAILWWMGFAAFRGMGATEGLTAAFLLSISSGVGEELVFRGAIYRLLEESFGTLVALIVSGALFGLVHLGNPSATLYSSAAVALEAGLLLGAAYTMTRSLWLPIGLHFAWNFTEGGIFGAAVSGNTMKGLIDAPLSGPELYTGGGFGPENSVIAVGVCVTIALVMLAVAARRGEWRPLRLRLRAP